MQKNGAGENIGKLTIQGGEKSTGKLTATGSSYGAGIGGGSYCNGLNITISGGTVTATGGGKDSESGIYRTGYYAQAYHY